MKIIILCLFIFTNFSSSNDKIQHMVVGASIYGVCIITGKIIDSDYLSEVNCLLPVFIAGAGKEIYDYKHPKKHSAEFLDVVATVSAPLLYNLIKFKF